MISELIGVKIGLHFSKQDYVHFAIFITFADLLILIFLQIFKDVLKRGYYQELASTIKHVCVFMLVVTFYVFALFNNDSYSKEIIYLTIGIYFVLSYCTRILWKLALKQDKVANHQRSLVIVTTKNKAGRIVKTMQKSNYSPYFLKGIAIIDVDATGSQIRGVDVIANIGNVVNYVCREWVDEVFVDVPNDYPFPGRLVDRFTEMGVVVHSNIESTAHKTSQNQIIEKFGPYTVLTTSLNFATPFQLFLKRVMDIIGGLIGTIGTFILFIFLAPMIYIKSPGPIFFKQERVGRNGKKFKMYKFRSMYLDAEDRKKELMDDNIMSDGLMFKAEWDERIIGSKKLPDGTTKKGIGNFIRDWSLDEFPQFINVLKGDMSLVGTRPPTIDEWEKYELHHRARLAAKPGITGMWQVSGRNKITDFEEVVKLDTQYINQWNVGLDIKILFKTVAVVFKKEGSM
jgi:exopolysaccharide biosynthesis polyprenyl glycosylphosphotransferase